MTGNAFNEGIADLKGAVIGALQAHFERRSLAFDVHRFLAETQTDLDQFLKEAYFLGAEEFPLGDQA
jgi:hypothetical protein